MFVSLMGSRGDVNLANCSIPAGEANYMLAALGLLHMRVKCVIPDEFGGNYKPKVSAVVVMVFVMDNLLTTM